MITPVTVSNASELRSILSQLVFARVKKNSLRYNANAIKRVDVFDMVDYNETKTTYSIIDLPSELVARYQSPLQKDLVWCSQHTETIATHFTCLASEFAASERRNIFVRSANETEYDVFDFKFKSRKLEHVVPYDDTLLCGTVVETPKGYEFDKWFYCSEQFMRMALCVVHGELHPHLQSLRAETRNEKNELELETTRRALMRGNRLAVSSNIHKERIARECSGVQKMSAEEESKRYARSHAEPITHSPSNIHYYNAIVMMVVYGEKLDMFNIPNNVNGPQVNTWIIEDAVKNALMSKLGVQAQVPVRTGLCAKINSIVRNTLVKLWSDECDEE